MLPKVRATTLPGIIDRRPEWVEPRRLLSPSPGEMDWTSPYAWAIVYQCVYEGGALDDELHGRAMGGATEGEALARLQKLLGGFGALKVLLWHVRPPLGKEAIAAIREANEELDRHREFWRRQWQEYDREYKDHGQAKNRDPRPGVGSGHRPLGGRADDGDRAASTAGAAERVHRGGGRPVPGGMHGLFECREGL